MMNNCFAPEGAFCMSRRCRALPLNFYSAFGYLAENGYIDDKGDLDEQEIYDDAFDFAADLYSGCCEKVADLFLAFENDEDGDNLYEIVCQVYSVWGEPIPLNLRAFAAMPEVWDTFCKMTADELELFLSDSGGKEDGEDS